MSKILKALQWMIDVANDSGHGYDQIYRWGEKGDYDCSSAIITACEYAGIPMKSQGATYTGNMRPVALKVGFKDITKSITLSTGKGLQAGDILLNTSHHVAMYCGNGKLVHASINELGKARGGKPGDQTGREFYIRSYYNYPWNCILRYIEDRGIAVSVDATASNIKEYENIEEILWELLNRNIVSDEALWRIQMTNDSNTYWLCRKIIQYVRTKNFTEYADNVYTGVEEILWELNHRGIISDTALWREKMTNDSNIYWLCQKAVHYIRTQKKEI